MNKMLLFVFGSFLLLASYGSCTKSTVAPGKGGTSNDDNLTQTGSKMKIKIGDSIFISTLYENATADAFKTKFPITINMLELNGNEKYTDIPSSLPTNASNPGTIQAGDLMLYGSSTLVLFYKTFSTSYTYTKLGRVDNVEGLVAALGSGNVKVTFELE